MIPRPSRRPASNAPDWRLLLCFALLVVAAGSALAWGMDVQSLVLIGVIAIIGFTGMPSWVWVAGAIGSAMLGRVVTSSGLLPSVFNFADFGIVYVGLASVLVRHWGSRLTPSAVRLSRALVMLFAVIFVSWLLHPSDVGRPFIVFLFWAEPFALILMLLIEPPSPRQRRLLIGCGATIAVLQLPFAVYQARTLGYGDPVVGTLLGASAGAHVMAGVTALFGLALVAWGFSTSLARGLWASLLAAPFIVAIPLVADAKQVVFVLPVAAAMLFVTTRGLSRKVAILVPVIAAVAFLVILEPAGQTALGFIQRASNGQSGKLASVDILLHEMGKDDSWAFGLGPANSLSRAAFMTGDYLKADSPLGAIGLVPATLPALLVAESQRVASGTSFNLPLSSALGIFGDVGIVGALAYGWVLASTCLALFRKDTWLARCALAGWAMSFPLALVFDWWEQPPFMLSIGLLTALALTEATDPSGAGRGAAHSRGGQVVEVSAPRPTPGADVRTPGRAGSER